MATMIKTISRLRLLQKSSPSPLRWFSTPVSSQPKADRSDLLFKLRSNPYDEPNIGDVLNEYNSLGSGIKRKDVILISNYLRNRKNFTAAVQLYDWLELNKAEMISNADQAIRISVLCNSRGIDSAVHYFNSLTDSEKTQKTYGALLSCYCKAKVLDKALETFDKINELNYMSTLNYNNILSLYINIGQPEKVPSLVEEMEKKGLHAEFYTWNLLINSYAAMGNIDAAVGVLEKMKNKRIECNSFTYGNLATICFNSGLHEKAKTLLGLMMEKIENEPYKDVVEAFRTLSKLYSEMNDLSGVLRAWEALKWRNFHLTNSSYLRMLLALYKLGDKSMLGEIYQEWEEKWVKSCEQTYHEKFDFRLPNVVMQFYLDQNMIKDATELYEKVSKRSSEPNLRALDSFAALFVKKTEIDLALDYLESGIEKSGSVIISDWFPQNETVESFVKYFEENKDMARVERFVELIKKVNHLDSSVYSSLLPNAEVTEAAK